MSWRPEGWNNPYMTLDDADEGTLDSLDDVRAATVAEMTHKAFEVGADAMLEAISEEIEKVKLSLDNYCRDWTKCDAYLEGGDKMKEKILALLKK